MTALHNYDPKKIIVTYGPIVISGFAEDEFLSIEADEETFTKQVGVDGEGTRTRNNNGSGKATITLMQSSQVNDLLAAAHELDKATGVGPMPFLVKDLFGNTLVAAEKAWITKPPVVAYGKEATSREWVLDSHDMRIFAGGSVL